MTKQTFRDTQFGQEHGQALYNGGDPYSFGRIEQMSNWERALNKIGRLFGRTLTRVEHVANRVFIQAEITHLRLRLRTLYNRLGKLIFYLRVAEERRDAADHPRSRAYLDKLRETHRELATQRAKLDKMNQDRQRDEFAGA